VLLACGVLSCSWFLAPRLISGPFPVLSGLLGTVVGRLARFVAIDKVGAPVAASINNLNPFISTGLGVVLLTA
jgi:drug/metabolite transporter (DMT)-like permease